MFNKIMLRLSEGKQFIPNIKLAQINEKFKGAPIINLCGNCKENYKDICPTNAIEFDPFIIDLGKCIFCGDCERICKNNCIKFTNFYKTAATSRENLIIFENSILSQMPTKTVASDKIKSIFKRSLKLRQISAGGCNACEMELNACNNVNFDMSRFGIDIVASPRHADGIIITGPITENMSSAVFDAFKSTPDPKIVIACGTCAISGGIFYQSSAINRKFFDNVKIDLFIPGCPPHPLTFINGLLEYLNI